MLSACPTEHHGGMHHDTQPDYGHLQRAAKDHLWMHFTRHSSYADADVPIIVRGEGAYLYDAAGKRYLDGLGGLFVSQLGHGRTELAEAAAAQARELAFHPLWSYAHPSAILLAEQIAGYAPGSLNRVFFSSPRMRIASRMRRSMASSFIPAPSGRRSRQSGEKDNGKAFWRCQLN